MSAESGARAPDIGSGSGSGSGFGFGFGFGDSIVRPADLVGPAGEAVGEPRPR